MTTPLIDTEKSLGAIFGMDPGSEIPVSYGDSTGEHHAVRLSAGLIDRSNRGLLRFTGADRAEYLHNMLTNDITALQPGSGCYAVTTTEKAKMLGDLRIACLADSLLIDVELSASEKIKKHLDKFIITSDVAIGDETKKLGLLTLSGPKSHTILSAVFPGLALPEIECGNIQALLGEISILIVRNDITGEVGFDCYGPREELGPLWETIMKAGKEHGLKPVGLRALESLRVEAGIPVYGIDMDESHFPMEAGIEKRAISYTKGCYLGQETIARADAHGHMNRRLMGLELSVKQLPPKGKVIFGTTEKGEKEIGRVTSAVFAPTLEKPIAMGYVHRDFMKPGSTVTIQGKSATVTDLPFYLRSS